jgi:hypothetical protein
MPAETNVENIRRPAGQPDLDALANRIKIEHAAIEKAIHDTRQNILPKAMKLGEDLQKVKDSLGHGKWGPWLQKTGINERKAQRYMELAKSRSKIEETLKSDIVSDLSLAAALRLANDKGTSR